MNKKDRQFEKNISRLLKQMDTSSQPGERFVQDTIEQALAELKQPSAEQQRDGKDKIMKRSNWIYTAAAVAAAVIIAAVIALPHLGKVQNPSGTDGQNVAVQDTPERPAAMQERFKQLNSPKPKTEAESSPRKDVSLLGDISDDMRKSPSARAVSMDMVVESKLNEQNAYFYRPVSEEPQPMAHGGTAPPNGEQVDAQFFQNYGVNPFVDTEDDHLSTFATDVDTGSYTVVRRYLNEGILPPKDAVRVEEFVNYFDYGYPAPQKDTFAVFMQAAPWEFGPPRKNSALLRIGLKARQVSEENRKPANLIFVIDVSGSMNRENRLGLVKKSLRLLVDKLRPEDKIGIAVYGSSGRKILEPTGLENRRQILDAIDSLESEGSTNAEEGILIGYTMADRAFEPGRINRVILCSDGVANVGRTGHEGIFEMIRDKADKGITLSALGFGMGNYNDVLMERLGDKGNGYYAYVDTLDEARRLFSNLTGALQVVARDVKVQVDFNPKVVRSYRLIGYENRDVPDEKFRDDTQDGGEMGAGHSVTALYEVKLWENTSGELAKVYVRYKDPDDPEKVTEFSSPFNRSEVMEGFDNADAAFALARVVTEFAEILRDSYWARGADMSSVVTEAREAAKLYPGNSDVIELIDLIEKADKMLRIKQQSTESQTEAAEPSVPESAPEPRPIDYQE